MGEIADDMIDGTSCSLCGQYFQDPKREDHSFTHGYPVVCKDCWSNLTTKERQDYQLATANTF